MSMPIWSEESQERALAAADALRDEMRGWSARKRAMADEERRLQLAAHDEWMLAQRDPIPGYAITPGDALYEPSQRPPRHDRALVGALLVCGGFIGWWGIERAARGAGRLLWRGLGALIVVGAGALVGYIALRAMTGG